MEKVWVAPRLVLKVDPRVLLSETTGTLWMVKSNAQGKEMG